jgi:hypothetical protein
LQQSRLRICPRHGKIFILHHDNSGPLARCRDEDFPSDRAAAGH